MVAVTSGWIRTTALLVAMLVGVAPVTATIVLGQDASPTAQQPVVVAETEITWTGAWEYDTLGSYSVTSVPDQAIFFQRDEDIDEEIGFVKLLTFGMLMDDSLASADDAVSLFAEFFLDGMSPNALAETARGGTEGVAAWGLYTFTPSPIDDVQDQSFSSLIVAEQGEGGAFAITSLTAPTDVFAETLEAVRSDFRVDGDGRLFEGIDIAEIMADVPEGESPGQELAESPVASPEATILASPEATPLGDAAGQELATPEATPLDSAEATLVAVQGAAQTPTPTVGEAGSPEPSPEG
jgi:hypothetical protein